MTTAAKVVDLDDYRPIWMTVRESCPCGFSCVGVVHRDADIEHLECGSCGEMTSRATEIWCGEDGFIVNHPKGVNI